MNAMSDNLLSAGEFARLARTTKRTILWYDQKGILKPVRVDVSGYRFYAPRQILDFQSVSLMRRLGFSIAEIVSLLKHDHSMRHLFEQQRGALERQIGQLQRMLDDTNRYYANLQASGTLVRPELKRVPSFDMYYIMRQGSYARIKDYHDELRSQFDVLPGNPVWLTAFMTSRYQPARAEMKIGVVCQPGMHLKPGAEARTETVPSYQALACTHVGSTTLLSLLWQELGKYRRQQRLPSAAGLPFADAEFYAPDTSGYPDPNDSLATELHMPVTVR